MCFVSPPRKPRRPGPPHNPGLHDLVEGKRQWSSRREIEDMKRGFRGWHERGYLPHRDEPGLTQFVTFRLADTFPESLRSEWEHLWRIEDNRERCVELEAYLDCGRGECHLRTPEIARLVEDNLLSFSGCCGSQTCAPNHGCGLQTSDWNDAGHGLQTRGPEPRYELRAWCLMPNHVHVLFKVGGVSMSETVSAWKKHTARLANRLLGKGGSFWAEDYFDTWMRDAEHESKTVRYVENNPVKARLVLDPEDWPWSSARFRDQFGVLKLPG
jgi:putative transposase